MSLMLRSSPARSRTRTPTLVVALVLATTLAAGCEPTLRTETGIVTVVDSPALGRVTGFRLRTADGRVLDFDTSGLRAEGAGFPAVHLVEHRATAQPVRVTFRTDGDRNVVVRLADADG